MYNIMTEEHSQPAGPYRRMRTHRGQTALVMLLIVAVAMVFFAISMNWGRIAEYKTLVTVGANVSAAGMASAMSSYGEMVLQTTLGGKTKICGWTGILAIIIAIVIIIIAIIVVIVSWGTLAAPMATLVLSVIGLVLAIAALAIQILVLQPGLTDLWNKMQQDLSIEGQFVERGIQAGLMSAVTDNKNIPDKMDMDRDGYHTINSEDEVINRFGHYYTRRLQSMQDFNIPEVRRFVEGLNKLTYAEGGVPGDWRISDPVDCSVEPHSLQLYCNPCCVPPEQRPDSCHAGMGTGPYPEVLEQCKSGQGHEAEAFFPHAYNPLRENELNNPGTVSFRESMGWDDELKEFEENARNPNLPQNHIGLGFDFQMKDATGYYTAANQTVMVNRGLMPPPPPDAITPDLQQGIFPFLWKLGSWEPGVAGVNAGVTANQEGCHWCAADVPIPPVCSQDPLTSAQLTLSADCETDDCCTAFHRAGDNSIDPRKTDLVYSAPQYTIQNAVADANICAINQDPLTGMHWKRGGDRYCSPDWPYWGDCPKHSSAGCTVAIGEDEFEGGEEINPETGNPYNEDTTLYEEGTPPCECQEPAPDWPDDPVDELVYGLEDYLRFVNRLSASTINDLEKTFVHWYPDAAEVIGYAGPESCVSCSDEDGVLRRWRNQLAAWSTQIGDWIYQYNNAAGFAHADAWCIPPSPDDLPPAEKYYILRHGNVTYDRLEEAGMGGGDVGCIAATDGVCTNSLQRRTVANKWGDLTDVIACLDYNSQNFHGSLGNEYKFDRCFGGPSAQNCSNLPRSLLASLDLYSNADYYDASEFDACLKSTCNGGIPDESCLTANLPAGYDLTGYNQNAQCAGFWGIGNASYDILAQHRETAWQRAYGSGPSEGFTPPPTEDVATLQNCLDSCSEATCGDSVLVAYVEPPRLITQSFNPATTCTTWGGPTEFTNAFKLEVKTEFDRYVIEGNDAYADLLQACLDSCSALTCGDTVLVGTPVGGAPLISQSFDPGTTCTAWGAAGDYTNPFKREVKAAMGGEAELLLKIYDSARLAANQYPKFLKRANFLKQLKAEAEVAQQHFFDGAKNLTAFLDPSFLRDPLTNAVVVDPETGDPLYGPAEGLIRARERVESEPISDLSNFAIYAWKGEPPNIPEMAGSTVKVARGSGYWHVVRAEGYLPKRCFGKCGPGGGSNEDWPKVKTYTKSWGMKRCYELVNRVGITRARVTRFDEDRDTRTRLMMGNGTPIWRFVFHNPVTGARSPENLDVTCNVYVEEGAEGAFMINEHPDVDQLRGRLTAAEAAQAELCWERVHDLLSAGVSTTSCGQYYLRGKHFVSRFIPCPDDNFFTSVAETRYE